MQTRGSRFVRFQEMKLQERAIEVGPSIVESYHFAAYCRIGRPESLEGQVLLLAEVSALA